MDRVHVIRDKVLREGRSIRSVAEELGHSRNTVRKYLRESEPVRKESQPRPQPVRERVRERLEELWEEWRPRSSRKHRVTASRVHRELVSEGYQISPSTVRRMVRELRLREQEVYVPLVYRAGDCAQVDFFEQEVELGGVRLRLWLFLMVLPFSGRCFGRLYEHCDQLSFFDGHVRAFHAFGGRPERIVYDNLKAAVKRRTLGEVELSERFRALASHYVFEPCFARPGEGHDKGTVEAQGKSVRLRHLVPILCGDSLEQLSVALSQHLETEVPASWEEERSALRPLASDFDCREHRTVTVSKRSLIHVGGAQYSVPSRWARRSVQVLVGVDSLEVSLGSESVVLERERRGGRRIEYRHYLPELARKPQAVRQIAPELVAQLGGAYEQLWVWLSQSCGSREAARVLSRVLRAVIDHGEVAVEEALAKALDQGRLDLLSLRGDSQRLEIAVPTELAQHVIESGEASAYDHLMQEAC